MNSSDIYAAIAIAAVSADEFHGRTGWAEEFRDRLVACVDGRIKELQRRGPSSQFEARIEALRREKAALVKAIETTREHYRQRRH